MYIDTQMMEKIAFGCVSMEQTEKGWYFHRFTQKQRDVFAAYNHYYPEPFFDGYFLRNCDTDASISIDFHTDSRAVTFHIAEVAPANDSKNLTFDILVNGKLYISDEKVGDYTLKLRKNSRVTLCFPEFAHLCLSGIELEDGAAVTPHTFNGRWLALGDSITHGCAALPSNAYVTKTALRYNMELINHGNSGYVHDYGTIVPEMDFQPDIITSAYGINDFFRKSREDNLADTLEYYKVLREAYPKAKIYCLSPIWTALLMGRENKEKRDFLYSIYDQVAAEFDVTLVDGSKLVPHDKKYFRDDGVHPLDSGYAFYASRLGKILFPEEK